MFHPIPKSSLLAQHDAWLEEMRKEPLKESASPYDLRLTADCCHGWASGWSPPACGCRRAIGRRHSRLQEQWSMPARQVCKGSLQGGPVPWTAPAGDGPPHPRRWHYVGLGFLSE